MAEKDKLTMMPGATVALKKNKNVDEKGNKHLVKLSKA